MPIPVEKIDAPVPGHEKTFKLAADNVGDRVVSPGILEHPVNHYGVGPSEKFRYSLDKETENGFYSTWTVGKGDKLEGVTEAGGNGRYHGLDIAQGKFTSYYDDQNQRLQQHVFAVNQDGTTTTPDGFKVTVKDGSISRIATRDNTTFDLDRSGRISQVTYSFGREQKVYKPQQQ